MFLESDEIHKQPSESSVGIEQYQDVARQIRVDLTRGYLFRPMTPDGGIQDSHFTSVAAEARLYLKKMGADDGETLHGFQSDCAITLALTGAELSEITCSKRRS